MSINPCLLRLNASSLRRTSTVVMVCLVNVHFLHNHAHPIHALLDPLLWLDTSKLGLGPEQMIVSVDKGPLGNVGHGARCEGLQLEADDGVSEMVKVEIVLIVT